MRRSIGIGGAALALVAALAALSTNRTLGEDAEPEGEIAWRTDLDAATAEAAKSGQPLFVVFRCER